MHKKRTLQVLSTTFDFHVRTKFNFSKHACTKSWKMQEKSRFTKIELLAYLHESQKLYLKLLKFVFCACMKNEGFT